MNCEKENFRTMNLEDNFQYRMEVDLEEDDIFTPIQSRKYRSEPKQIVSQCSPYKEDDRMIAQIPSSVGKRFPFTDITHRKHSTFIEDHIGYIKKVNSAKRSDGHYPHQSEISSSQGIEDYLPLQFGNGNHRMFALKQSPLIIPKKPRTTLILKVSSSVGEVKYSLQNAHEINFRRGHIGIHESSPGYYTLTLPDSKIPDGQARVLVSHNTTSRDNVNGLLTMILSFYRSNKSSYRVPESVSMRILRFMGTGYPKVVLLTMPVNGGMNWVRRPSNWIQLHPGSLVQTPSGLLRLSKTTTRSEHLLTTNLPLPPPPSPPSPSSLSLSSLSLSCLSLSQPFISSLTQLRCYLKSERLYATRPSASAQLSSLQLHPYFSIADIEVVGKDEHVLLTAFGCTEEVREGGVALSVDHLGRVATKEEHQHDRVWVGATCRVQGNIYGSGVLELQSGDVIKVGDAEWEIRVLWMGNLVV